MKLYSAVYSEWNPLDSFYPDGQCVLVTKPDDLKEEGILIIHGGGDIHPSLYNRDNVHSHVGETVSKRDALEWALMNIAVDKKIPIFGICRGAQMACALAGGILIQDVPNHHGNHRVVTNDKRQFTTSSIHHQMMYPWKVEHTLLAWTLPLSSTQRFTGLTPEEIESIPNVTDKVKYEPEVVWFPEIRALAVQGHPEMMDPNHPFNRYLGEQCARLFTPST